MANGAAHVGDAGFAMRLCQSKRAAGDSTLAVAAVAAAAAPGGSPATPGTAAARPRSLSGYRWCRCSRSGGVRLEARAAVAFEKALKIWHGWRKEPGEELGRSTWTEPHKPIDATTTTTTCS